MFSPWWHGPGHTFCSPGCHLPFHHLVVAHSDAVPGANASARVSTHSGFSLSWNHFSGEAMNYFAIVITNYHGWVIWMAAIYFHAVLKVRSLRLKYLQCWFLHEFLSWKTADWLTSPWASGYLCLYFSYYKCEFFWVRFNANDLILSKWPF